MNSLARSVPWFDWEEWFYVFKNIFSGQQQDSVEALDVVRLWKIRGKVGAKIDAIEHFSSKSPLQSVHMPWSLQLN